MKIDPGAGVAIIVTTCPEIKGVLQVAPQLMPTGLLVTVPLPVPVRKTLRVAWEAFRNENVQFVPESKVTV
jgi:hypothetical protein